MKCHSYELSPNEMFFMRSHVMKCLEMSLNLLHPSEARSQLDVILPWSFFTFVNCTWSHCQFIVAAHLTMSNSKYSVYYYDFTLQVSHSSPEENLPIPRYNKYQGLWALLEHSLGNRVQGGIVGSSVHDWTIQTEVKWWLLWFIELSVFSKNLRPVCTYEVPSIAAFCITLLIFPFTPSSYLAYFSMLFIVKMVVVGNSYIGELSFSSSFLNRYMIFGLFWVIPWAVITVQ